MPLILPRVCPQRECCGRERSGFAVSVPGSAGWREGASVQLVERRGAARLHCLVCEKTVEDIFRVGLPLQGLPRCRCRYLVGAVKHM